MENSVTLARQPDFLAEKRLLSALYKNNSLLDNDKITEDLFSTDSTKHVFEAMQNLKGRDIPFTHDTLLQEYSVIDLNASDYVIDVIVNEDPEDKTNYNNINDILDQLFDFKKRRQISDRLEKAKKIVDTTARLTDSQKNEISELIDDSEILMQKNDDHKVSETMDFESWFKLYQPEYKKRENGKQYYFNNFIFDTLVETGPLPGEIGILASASGSGKSTVCTNLINSLIETKVPCMYYSLEMSAVSIMDRLLAKRLQIKYKDIINPSEDNFEMIDGLIQQEKEELSKNKFFRFSEDPAISLASLRKQIMKFQAEIGSKYCIIVLDLLSMVTDFTKFDKGANSAFGIEVAINKLSSIAKELGVHFIGVLQMNRSKEAAITPHSVDDLIRLKPSIADIKNAGAWVERGRYIITCFRKKYYAERYLEKEEYADMEDRIEISLVKVNNGQLDTMEAMFCGEYFDVIPIEQQGADLDSQDDAFTN
jgi:replicative DNA helicase